MLPWEVFLFGKLITPMKILQEGCHGFRKMHNENGCDETPSP
jgi:hypothetical protein